MTSFFETEAAREAFYRFPDIFEQAKEDWARFKMGRAQGLFTAEQAREVLGWFRDFPRLWETLRPNWSENISETQRRFAERVDRFVSDVGAASGLSGLGLIPIVIAGVIIVGGVAAALWAGGYIKKQMNISRMIDGVTAGRISESALRESLKEQPGLFGDVSGMIKWLVIGGVGLFAVLPALKARYER